ncbi:MAG: nucleotidyltransferase substrate binding protein [Alphaproteobacteria bacterium GM202ARS2]|nr:nucleotidyltransferase substrate binding protein [Alphaproteobacteria bacterium GM202ARS2]
MVELDISPLEKAVAQLELFLAQAEKEKNNPDNRRMTQTASIKAFTDTYEVSHRMLRRFLEMTEANMQDVRELSFQGLIRLSLVRGLVKGEVKAWLAYRDKRNKTSHVYDDGKAQEVFSVVPDFLQEARFVCATLRARIKQG